MRILNGSGHSEMTWDEKTQEGIIRDLERRFYQETKHAVAFDVSGKKPRIIKQFDRKADIVISPLFVGG